MSSREPMAPACSGTIRTCGVNPGHPAPWLLLLLRDQQDLCCRLRYHCLPLHKDPQDLSVILGPPVSCCSGTQRSFAVFSGHTASCRLLRDPQDQWCYLGIPCSLPETTQGPTGPELSSVYPLLSACRCSGTRRTCVVILGLTVPCMPLLRALQFLCCSLGSCSTLQC